MTSLVQTRWGPVEFDRRIAGPPVVVVFPGGHCTAATDIGQDLYTELGYSVVSFSRPGYGRTDVGPLTFAEFAPVITEVCQQLGLDPIVAVVGVSFGGQQAIHLSRCGVGDRLILHSCAPSSIPFPTGPELLLSPLAFGIGEVLTWAAIRRLVRSDKGLELMMSNLSTLPTSAWFDRWTVDDRARARTTFNAMRSGKGFMLDTKQGTPPLSQYRKAVQRTVSVPTLITASRYDGGTSFDHATDLCNLIPDAELHETDAESHFYWLGPRRQPLQNKLTAFLHP